MKEIDSQESEQFNINRLAELTGFSVRSIRYYVQQGLLDKPNGVKRQAFYELHHLEQLMLIRKGQDAGYSLERINQLIRNPESFKPIPEQQVGSLTVKSHIQLTDGVELVITPEMASLTAEQLRVFSKQCIQTLQAIKENSDE